MTPRRTDLDNPTCVSEAVMAAIEFAFTDPGQGRPEPAMLEDCRCWVADARHYTLVFNHLQEQVGVDNALPVMVCLDSAVKLAEVSISFEWWNDQRLVPVMQMGTFAETTQFFRVVCFPSGRNQPTT